MPAGSIKVLLLVVSILILKMLCEYLYSDIVELSRGDMMPGIVESDDTDINLK